MAQQKPQEIDTDLYKSDILEGTETWQISIGSSRNEDYQSHCDALLKITQELFPKIKFGSIDTKDDDGKTLEASLEIDEAKSVGLVVIYVQTSAISGKRSVIKIYEWNKVDLSDHLNMMLEEVYNSQDKIDVPKVMGMGKFYFSRPWYFWIQKNLDKYDDGAWYEKIFMIFMMFQSVGGMLLYTGIGIHMMCCAKKQKKKAPSKPNDVAPEAVAEGEQAGEAKKDQ